MAPWPPPSRRLCSVEPDGFRRPAASSVDEERGAATAEFTMVAALLALLFVLTLQLAVLVHVRNTLIDAASTGARFGALDDRSAEDGVARTE
ncbi:TadE/TadG family type IV pilus assembly protein [Nesterenkonia sp. F]|uniref:TadE/TadG family type IV pilus assembly protein n=1 Tax=Nesterenkonia sp. F TaxID=795955 RepID=UPI001ED8F49C|nr:TadE/TadG family type IV pilus assembly protein [Nesterenkonia sp. F]